MQSSFLKRLHQYEVNSNKVEKWVIAQYHLYLCELVRLSHADR